MKANNDEQLKIRSDGVYEEEEGEGATSKSDGELNKMKKG